MNKILIENRIICDNNKIKIDDNVIIFLEDGEYEIEYLADGEYDITFVIDGNIKIIEYGFDRKLSIKKRYIINGKLEVVKFYNNLEVDELDNIDLCKTNSEVLYRFHNICRGSENYVINVNHNSEKTISNIINRSVAVKNSKINFTVNSNVLDNAIKSVLDQNTRIVTMGECESKISPNMFIPIDDVNAKHGSIIGTFKDDQIFYLMSKGISYNDTLKLLIKGYLLADIVINSELRNKIIKIIDTYWR